jgi:hypothetical protein
VRAELLYRDGDASVMEVRQRLVEVLTEDAFETPIQLIAVATDADAELLAMRGSPTVRIDGADIDPQWDGPIGLDPRPYPGGALPDKALIRRAVERARGWGHGRVRDAG